MRARERLSRGTRRGKGGPDDESGPQSTPWWNFRRPRLLQCSDRMKAEARFFPRQCGGGRARQTPVQLDRMVLAKCSPEPRKRGTPNGGRARSGVRSSTFRRSGYPGRPLAPRGPRKRGTPNPGEIAEIGESHGTSEMHLIEPKWNTMMRKWRFRYSGEGTRSLGARFGSRARSQRGYLPPLQGGRILYRQPVVSLRETTGWHPSGMRGRRRQGGNGPAANWK